MKVRLDPDGALVTLRSMPSGPHRRMHQVLRRPADDPPGREVGLDVKRARTPGDPPVFRLRIGAWRAAWLLHPDHLGVLRVFHRSEGHSWLERRYP